MKLQGDQAWKFAAKVVEGAQQVSDSYIKELSLGDMVAWAVRGIYQSIDEKMPQDIRERVD